MERNLQFFMHRSKVLKQYRTFQRVLSKLRRSPEISVPHAELAAQVRQEFRSHRDETDMQRARFFLQEGERQLKTVLALVATTGPSGFDPFNMHQGARAAAYAGASGGGKGKLVSRATGGDGGDSGDRGVRGETGDTVVDTDGQGRLGVEWPWERE